MLDQNLQNKIKELFEKKEYQKIISEVENFTKIENRPGGLSSLVGVCKMLIPNYTKEDVISALSDFEDAFRKFQNSPGSIEVLSNYTTACIKNSQKFIEIVDYFIKAKILFEEAEKNFGYNEKLYLCGIDIHRYLIDTKKVLQLSKQVWENNPKLKVNACTYGVVNNYFYDWGIEDYFKYSKKFKTIFPKLEVKNIKEINYSLNKKIKIGFVSCDFIGNHSVTYFVKNTIKNIDKVKFEISVYQVGKNSVLEESSKELKNNADNWHDLTNFSNQEIINKIQDDKIEILFDIMGLTNVNRIEIFNNRVSPTQISWLAFCNTVGFDDIDYLVADKNLIYDNEDKYYSEKIIKLNKIWNCHSGFSYKRIKPNLPYKRNKYITFGSFNNFLKISDEVVRTWSKILKSVKNSKLILKSSFSYQTKNIISKFKSYGVEKQIRFFDRQYYLDIEDHLKLYNEVDIALDTFPYNGVTTTFEALWSGVPVLVMKGYNFNSRCGESIVINGNLDYFIAKNEDEYFKKAVYLSKNIDKLIFYRNHIFDNILNTPLYDSAAFSKDLENELLKLCKKKL